MKPPARSKIAELVQAHLETLNVAVQDNEEAERDPKIDVIRGILEDVLGAEVRAGFNEQYAYAWFGLASDPEVLAKASEVGLADARTHDHWEGFVFELASEIFRRTQR